MKFSKGPKKVVKGFKLRWINGWGDEFGNYPYRFYLEKDGEKIVDIPNELMDEFFEINNGWKVGTNMFRGATEKKATKKLVDFLKEKEVLKGGEKMLNRKEEALKLLELIVEKINNDYTLTASLIDNTIFIDDVQELEDDDPEFIKNEIRLMIAEVVTNLGYNLVAYVVNPVSMSYYNIKIADDELNDVTFEIKIEGLK